ncbi:MAG: hypothetical protein ABIR51_08160 [Sphingomicrobium sp.]
MNPFEFVLAIIVITTIGGIIRSKQAAKYGRRDHGGRWGLSGLPLMGRRNGTDDDYMPEENGETRRLRDEVQSLKQRIQTLERIAVDKENSLAREIDDLRKP